MSSVDQLGYQPFFSVQFELLPDAHDLLPARVVSESHGLYELGGAEAQLGELTGTLRKKLRPTQRPTTGDWVAIREAGERAQIQHVLERRTCLRRRGASSELPQVIAANVDVFFVVTSANRDLNPRRLERYLAAVLDSGADPVVVLNKLDLVDDPTDCLRKLETVALETPVVCVSALTRVGLADLERYLQPGKTVSFIGSSGVGKSSLINCLLGFEHQSTGDVGSDAKGRHTTTARQLIVTSEHGIVIDTPGMRELGMVDDDGGLEAAFADLGGFAEACRFRDCQHESEPGCGVQAAVQSGKLPAERLISYHKLRREVRAAQARQDPVLRANVKRRWKSITKSTRKRLR